MPCLKAFLGAIAIFAVMSTNLPAADETGFRPIFDGKTLDGWDGDPTYWRVEQGVITGQTTPETKLKASTFLIWRGGKPADFELKLEFKLTNFNSGVQYRSVELPIGRWIVGGYQADIEQDKYTGIFYEERGRGILGLQGQKIVIGENHKSKVVETFANRDELLKTVKQGDWNRYHIIAKGNHFQYIVNDRLMVDATDEDTQKRRDDGIIAFQLHAGPPMKTQFRNIRLKETPPEK